MTRSLLVLCLLVGAAVPAAAQHVERSPWASAAARPALAAPTPALDRAAVVNARAAGSLRFDAAPAPRPAVRGSGPLRLLHVLGGALVGAGVGYFTSQFVMSSWSDRSHSTSGAQLRRNYTLSGAALGAVTGIWTGRARVHQLAEGAAPVAGTGTEKATASRSRDVLTFDELQQDAAASVYQIIQTRRPAWLQPRGVNSFREGSIVVATGSGGQAVEIPGDPQIIAYRDGIRLGDVTTLKEVPASSVIEVHYYDAAAATYRFGIGNTHGAIEVLTH